MMNEFFRAVRETGEPPLCAAPEEAQSAIIGMPFIVDIVASDPDGLITGITADLPRWAALETITELPSPDVIAHISGTPSAEDKGARESTIVVTDDKGRQASGILKINVGDGGFPDEQPGVF